MSAIDNHRNGTISQDHSIQVVTLYNKSSNTTIEISTTFQVSQYEKNTKVFTIPPGQQYVANINTGTVLTAVSSPGGKSIHPGYKRITQSETIDYTDIDDFAGIDITDEEKQIVLGWFPTGTRFSSFYRATADGWNQVDFSDKYEAKGHYLIFGITDGSPSYMFGGYAPEGFEYGVQEVASTHKDTFAFSLRNPFSTPKQFKATISTGTSAYYKQGPWHSLFGANDVLINMQRAAFYRNMYGASILEGATDTFFTGKKENRLSEIVAFQVILP